MKKNMSLTYLVSILAVLVLSCVSCSHTRTAALETGVASEVQADSGAVTDDASSDAATIEGSTENSDQAAVSDEAADKASSLLGDSESKNELEATTAPDEKKADVAQLDTSASASQEPSQPELLSTPVSSENSVPPSDTETGSIAAGISSVAPAETETTTDDLVKPENPEKNQSGKVSKPERRPSNKESRLNHGKSPVQSKTPGEGSHKSREKTGNVTSIEPDIDEVDEVLKHAPIPAPEKVAVGKADSALASVEISSFIERHVFLVTAGVVGFVFVLFILMRRNRKEDTIL